MVITTCVYICITFDLNYFFLQIVKCVCNLTRWEILQMFVSFWYCSTRTNSSNPNQRLYITVQSLPRCYLKIWIIPSKITLVDISSHKVSSSAPKHRGFPRLSNMQSDKYILTSCLYTNLAAYLIVGTSPCGPSNTKGTAWAGV